MVCWAVRNGHVALLKSLKYNSSTPIGEYFIDAFGWFGSKNILYPTDENNLITGL
jgi:hypothetical protein